MNIAAGRYEDCVELSRRTLELDPYSPLIHNSLGRAYEFLGRPREAGSIRLLKVHSDWDPLRADPRFQDLLRRTNQVTANMPHVTPEPAGR